MKCGEWADDQASFWLYPIMLVGTIFKSVAKLFGLLAMGFIVFGLYLVLWVVVGVDAERRNIAAGETKTYSTNVSLGTVADRGEEFSHADNGWHFTSSYPDDHRDNFIGSLRFCGEGKLFFSRAMQNSYWDHWYQRKTGWLYQHYVEGSLNVYALKYVVRELKAGRMPRLLSADQEDYVDSCPGGAFVQKSHWIIHPDSPDQPYQRDEFVSVPDRSLKDGTMIPHIDIMWNLSDGPVITGYCLAGWCEADSEDDFLLHINRWGDTFAPEPPYSDRQKAAIRAFEGAGTEEFWKKYAGLNGLDPHSVDEYWRQNQKFVKATINLAKASTREIDKAYGLGDCRMPGEC